MHENIGLSAPLTSLEPYYPIVVVGSGYGGAIAASRLARAGQRVCLLERGREHRPGTFPRDLQEATREVQIESPHGSTGRPTGLYDFRLAGDINAFVGCGLGGTSLVNANVAIRPDPRLFEDARFPHGFRAEVGTELAVGYECAEAMLQVAPYPKDAPDLPKLQAVHDSARHMGMPSRRLPLAIRFEDGVNAAGVEQKRCNGCGDCVTGCNHGAKNTLDRNYLPDARAHGAQIFTGVQVRAILPAHQGAPGRWRIAIQILEQGRERFDGPELFLHADDVILAAGVFGTSEILLRSRERGLSLSPRLGHGFSGNGDVIGFAYNTDREIRGVGFGKHLSEAANPVGPCITAVIDGRSGTLDQGIIIEDGSLPGPLAPLLPALFQVGAQFLGSDSDDGARDRIEEMSRVLHSQIGGALRGALRNTQTFLVMSHDDAAGVLTLDGERVSVSWPDVGRQPVFDRIDGLLRKATEALGGTYVINPTWSRMLGNKLITVHPLGGCGMGEDAEHGVVDHKHRVFQGHAGTDVHPGLYVCDGSVLPRAIGVNPFLTISAMTERAMAHMARDRGWCIDYASMARRAGAPAGDQPGLRFAERMRGHLVDELDGTRSALGFVLTIVSDDLNAMLADPDHRACLVGTVDAPALSTAPLTVLGGRSELISQDAGNPQARRMHYQMSLHSVEGRVFCFDGCKQIEDQPGLDLWSDATRLTYTLYEGPDQSGRVLGNGELHTALADLARQIATMEVSGVADPGQRRRHLVRFLRFIGRALMETYLMPANDATPADSAA